MTVDTHHRTMPQASENKQNDMVTGLISTNRSMQLLPVPITCCSAQNVMVVDP